MFGMALVAVLVSFVIGYKTALRYKEIKIDTENGYNKKLESLIDMFSDFADARIVKNKDIKSKETVTIDGKTMKRNTFI